MSRPKITAAVPEPPFEPPELEELEEPPEGPDAGDMPETETLAEPESKAPAAPVVARGHAEATCLAFTRLYDRFGNEWSLTLREGITSEQLDRLLTAMEYTAKVADKHGFRLNFAVSAPPAPDGPEPQILPQPSRQAQTPGGPATRPAGPQPVAPPPPRPGGAPGGPTVAPNLAFQPVMKIVIQPNPGVPRVEFWGKPNLRYPLTTAPANIVAQKLAERYNMQQPEVDLAYLFDPGKQWTVNWSIRLVDSESLNRNGKPYKNIGELVDLDRE